MSWGPRVLPPLAAKALDEIPPSTSFAPAAAGEKVPKADEGVRPSARQLFGQQPLAAEALDGILPSTSFAPAAAGEKVPKADEGVNSSARLLFGQLGLAVFVLLVSTVSCRTSMPDGSPVAPVRAASAEASMIELRERLEEFAGLRSLMRLRVTSAGKTQSFRAQLVIPTREEMELIIYTPVGTTAATFRAKGDVVSSDVPADVSQALTSWLSMAGAAPADTALLILGLPAVGTAVYEAAPGGLRSASVADATITFDPPRFPPVRVVVRRGGDVVEIEHQETVQIR